MDAFILAHLQRWIDQAIPGDETEKVESGIVRYVTEYPEVIEMGWSWPEIRSVAEREGYILPAAAAKQA